MADMLEVDGAWLDGLEVDGRDVDGFKVDGAWFELDGRGARSAWREGDGRGRDFDRAWLEVDARFISLSNGRDVGFSVDGCGAWCNGSDGALLDVDFDVRFEVAFDFDGRDTRISVMRSPDPRFRLNLTQKTITTISRSTITSAITPTTIATVFENSGLD